MEWAPIGHHLTRPVGPHVGYCVDMWAKLGLGFWAVNWVWNGPQLGPSQQAQLGPTLDIVWMCGLNWAWVSGLFTGYGVGPNWAPTNKPIWPHLGYGVDTWAKLGLCFWAVYRV